MSAHLVSKAHIDALVTAGLWKGRRGESPLPAMRWVFPAGSELPGAEGCQLVDVTAGGVGAMLWAENRLSVNYKYGEDEWEPAYVFEQLPGTVDPLVVLKAINCYVFQSCEHPGWWESEARTFCDILQERMIRQLPGYDKAAGWEISDRLVFTRR